MTIDAGDVPAVNGEPITAVKSPEFFSKRKAATLFDCGRLTYASCLDELLHPASQRTEKVITNMNSLVRIQEHQYQLDLDSCRRVNLRVLLYLIGRLFARLPSLLCLGDDVNHQNA